jgi:hypothetical protein
MNPRCIKLAEVVGGRPDVIMADSVVWRGHRYGGGTGPSKLVGVRGPSSTRATKVPMHHSPDEPTGVGEEAVSHRVSFAPFWLRFLAC